MAIYMHIDGIKGSCQDKNHQGWIELRAKSFSVHRSVRSSIGVGNDRELGTPSLGEFSICKDSDASSAKLLQAAFKGSNFPKITINVCKSGHSHSVIDQYTLSNVVISDFEDASISDNAQRGKEYLTLNFRNLEVRHTNYDNTGKASSPFSVSYDLDKATC